MIDSNTDIKVTFKVATDTFTLAQGWQNAPYGRITLERLARSDESTWSWTRQLLEGFRGNEPTIFLNYKVSSSGVDDSRPEFNGKRNLPKWQFCSKSCSEA
jgi:hypothetical protein